MKKLKTYIIYQDRVHTAHENSRCEYFYGEPIKSGMYGLKCWLKDYKNWQLVTAPNASLAYQYGYLLKICEKSDGLKAKDKLNDKYIQHILHNKCKDADYPDWVEDLRVSCRKNVDGDLHISHLAYTPLVYDYSYLKHLDAPPVKPKAVKPKPVKPKKEETTPKPKLDNVSLLKNTEIKTKTNAQNHANYLSRTRFKR